MEKLTINHLSPYLPYSLKVIMEGKKCNVAWMSTKNIAVIKPNSIGDIKKINWEYAHLNVKPILRPLSDLTKEIEHKGEKFVPTELLDSDEYPIDFFVDTKYEYMEDWINSFKKEHHILFLPWGLINQLIEWHFDVFDLIPKGLAIDINTLEP